MRSTESVEPATVASRRRRLAAFLFDHFLFSMLGAFGLFLQLGPRWDLETQLAPGAVLPTFGVVLALTFCKDVIGGQSIGRAVFAIQVRDAADPGRVPSAWRLIRRNLFLPIWPVELVALSLSERRQRLGDRVAATCVVRVPTPLRPRLLAGAGFATAMLGLFLAATTHLVRDSAAYEAAVAHLRGDAALADRIGAVTGFGRMPAGVIRIQDGDGRAELRIAVEGERGRAYATVQLVKPPEGAWGVTGVALD